MIFGVLLGSDFACLVVFVGMLEGHQPEGKLKIWEDTGWMVIGTEQDLLI